MEQSLLRTLLVLNWSRNSLILWNQKLYYRHCINQRMHSVKYNKIQIRLLHVSALRIAET
jgi:hypothetical protein